MRRAAVGVVGGIVALGIALAPPAGASIDPADRAEARRPGPLRVVLVGDSITYNYQDEAAALLRPRGYQVFEIGVPGIGLLDRDFCNASWARLVRKMADPDIVVFESNGNYGVLPQFPACNPRKEYGSKPWLRRWRNAAINNQRQFTRRGAQMLWVEVPTVNFSPKREVVPMLNSIYREVGPTIDTWTPFGSEVFDPTFHYDDQHLNQEGADLMAEVVVEAILGTEE
jgi:hypothetical protein